MPAMVDAEVAEVPCAVKSWKMGLWDADCESLALTWLPIEV
jgi:hypothetical protein